VVVGGSAGGLEALTRILSRLPPGFAPPVVVVLHQHESNDAYLAAHLSTVGPLPAVEAIDKQPVEAGTVHVAPPGYHLLVERDRTLSLSVDERVNWSRPSIDVLFESAARVWAHELVGVVLSGANDDGARGLGEIERLGGEAVVQDPETASHPVMCRAALEATRAGQALSPEAVADLLVELAGPAGTGRGEGA
jgi:two-component system chemotaxis response regulator CheB